MKSCTCKGDIITHCLLHDPILRDGPPPHFVGLKVLTDERVPPGVFVVVPGGDGDQDDDVDGIEEALARVRRKEFRLIRGGWRRPAEG